MPTQQAVRTKRQGRTNVIYRDAKGKTRSAIVRATAARPATPVVTLTPSITGGTLAAGTYFYRVAATNANGNGLASAELSAVVASGTTGSVSISVGAVAGATSYKFYGRTTGAEQLMVSQAGTTYVDDNSATPSGALPTLATTPGNATVDPQYSNYTAGGVTSVPQALAMRGSGVKYFLRFGSPAGYPQQNRT